MDRLLQWALCLRCLSPPPRVVGKISGYLTDSPRRRKNAFNAMQSTHRPYTATAYTHSGYALLAPSACAQVQHDDPQIISMAVWSSQIERGLPACSPKIVLRSLRDERKYAKAPTPRERLLTSQPPASGASPARCGRAPPQGGPPARRRAPTLVPPFRTPASRYETQM